MLYQSSVEESYFTEKPPYFTSCEIHLLHLQATMKSKSTGGAPNGFLITTVGFFGPIDMTQNHIAFQFLQLLIFICITRFG